MSDLFHRLRNLETQLLAQSLGCNQGCRAMMLGTFSQGMKLNSWLPLPLSPYFSLSISLSIKKLRAIKGADYYCSEEDYTSQIRSRAWRLENVPLSKWKPNSDEEVPARLVRHNCRLEDHLKKLLDTTDAKIKGLELSNYLCK